MMITASGGRVYTVRSNGTLATFNGDGRVITLSPDGRVRSIHTRAIDVTDAHGQRTVVLRRPDNSVVVSTGPHSGYVQRPVVASNGKKLLQRTYVVNNTRVTRVYDTYLYHGVTLSHYIPAFYYAPEFYGWAYYPWNTPIAYPWFGSYGGYFTPWAAYPNPSYWLTDYILNETLAAAYRSARSRSESSTDDQVSADEATDEQSESDNESYAKESTPLTTEIKAAIAEEVKEQVASENVAAAKPEQAAAVDSLPQVMVPGHLFIVDQSLNVAITDQEMCTLSAGDVLRLVTQPAEGSQMAALTVSAGRRLDCPAGVEVTVALQDLQDMHDSFRARLSAGLQSLHDNQGKKGLPAAPKSAIAPPPRPAQDVTADNTNVEAAISSARLGADNVQEQATTLAFTTAQSRPAQTGAITARKSN
jgi:hypothetical protein